MRVQLLVTAFFLQIFPLQSSHGTDFQYPLDELGVALSGQLPRNKGRPREDFAKPTAAKRPH